MTLARIAYSNMILANIVKRAFLVALLVGAWPLLCAAAQQQSLPAECRLSGADYSIYSALLTLPGGILDPKKGSLTKEVIIVDSTSDDQLEDQEETVRAWGKRRREGTLATPSPETVTDFYAKISKVCPLQKSIDYAPGYRFINRKDLDDFFRSGGSWWPGFYKKYPNSGGFWEFSLIGYNNARNEAMVYVGHHCGGLCGTGVIYLLARSGDSWDIKNRLLVWIS